MKLILTWLAVLCVAAITAGSCSIDHKSGEYECTKQADCQTGRQCIGGYCVVPGGVVDAKPMTDGPKADARPIDAPMDFCPPQCTSCGPDKTCNIDCGMTNCNGNSAIVCPAGYNCSITCSTNNACANGIDCSAATSCAITCGGQGSCRGIECGTGDCDVKCTGQNSCRGVDCGDSCACDVSCALNSACEFLTCSSPLCDPIGRGCTSMGSASCDTCP